MASKTRHSKKATWFHVEEEENSEARFLSGVIRQRTLELQRRKMKRTAQQQRNVQGNQKRGVRRSITFGIASRLSWFRYHSEPIIAGT